MALVIVPSFTSFLIRTIAWKTILADNGPLVRPRASSARFEQAVELVGRVDVDEHAAIGDRQPLDLAGVRFDERLEPARRDRAPSARRSARARAGVDGRRAAVRVAHARDHDLARMRHEDRAHRLRLDERDVDRPDQRRGRGGGQRARSPPAPTRASRDRAAGSTPSVEPGGSARADRPRRAAARARPRPDRRRPPARVSASPAHESCGRRAARSSALGSPRPCATTRRPRARPRRSWRGLARAAAAPRAPGISSATIATAISSGVSAPMSSPIGACSRAKRAGSNALVRRAAA